MDRDWINLFRELNFCQHKITILFQEWSGYKTIIETMKIKIANMLDEHNVLQKENSKLKKNFEKSKSLIEKCLDMLQKNDNKKHSSPDNFEIALGKLKQIVLDALKIEKNSVFSHNGSEESDLTERDKCNFEKRVQCKKSIHVEHRRKSFPENNFVMAKNISNFCFGTYEKCSLKRSNGSDFENCTKSTSESLINVEVTNFQDNHSNEFIDYEFDETRKKVKEEYCDRVTLKADQKKLLTSTDTLISTLKRKSKEVVEVEDNLKSLKNTSKKRKTNFTKLPGDLNSTYPIKKSNSKDAMLAVAGIKRVTQNLSSINELKIKSLETKEILRNNTSMLLNHVSSKISQDAEDDFISESPNSVPSLQDLVASKKGNNLNQNKMLQPGKMKKWVDLDETYLPSVVVENCKLSDEENKNADDILSFDSNVNRCSRSPEFDSIPYTYRKKRSRFNKKSEETRLHKETCSGCNKYFENEYGKNSKGEENFRNIFKSSRHRKQQSDFKIEDTPPGYWKPYLTNSDMLLSNTENLEGGDEEKNNLAR